MEARLNFFEKGQNAVKPLFALGSYIKKSTLGRQLVELVDFRISQINGCAYCLDMHSKELRAMGETEQRLYGLNAWREAPYYTDRERAALAWAEAVNALHVTDEVYKAVSAQLTEEEIVDLTMAVSAINAWNRINIAFPAGVGTYRVGQFG
ncbi:alkylhydroperoxidase AhpD family core domain-containing protein [Dyadobacter sp. SG02]|uniref:carboxymuconolactone decarboxylase family protein n=1 Tax=Dyadobacter sp. SG02 TaxID=1855291 RepID=UPI0008C084EF|nr:carboxymuconolactone decarboxylase family protein [Dyadobacter sp. SG02]SEJ66337.1 alkylhydroperoxidase AhpD family core domain-containing protein [Dyadobacter sp. SG02]